MTQMLTANGRPHVSPAARATAGGALQRRDGRDLHDLSDARGELARLLLIRGGPGSGKSRRLAEVEAEHRAAGYTGLAIRARRDQVGHRACALVEAMWSTDIAGLAPVATARGTLTRLALAGSAESTAATGAVRECLAALRSLVPLVVVVDDLDWLDDRSLRLLPVLLGPGTAPVTLAVAHCAHDLRRPVRECLAALGASARTETVDVAPLTAGQAADLARLTLGADPGEDLIAGLTYFTQGNPLLFRHLLASLPDLPLDRPALSLGALISSVQWGEQARREIIERMLPAGRSARAVATAVAFLAPVRERRLDLIALLARCSPTASADELDRLIGQGIITEHPDRTLSFRVPALGHVLVQMIGPAQRSLWHALSADWLRRLPQASATLLELAPHLVAVAEPGDMSSVDLLARAAEQFDCTASATATAYYRAALGLLDSDDPRRWPLTGRLARALVLSGHVREAHDTALTAIDMLPDGADRSRIARLAAETSEVLGERHLVGIVGDYRDQRGHVAHILAVHAHMLARVGELGRAPLALADAELAIAGEALRGQVMAAVHVAHAQGLLGQYAAMLRTLSAILDNVDDAKPAVRIGGRVSSAFLLAMHGDRRSEPVLRETAELLRRLPTPFFERELRIARILRDYHAGQWDAALDGVNAIEEELAGAGLSSTVALVRAIRTGILVYRGLWQSARCVTIVDSELSTQAVGVWSQAAVDLDSGEPEQALRRLSASLDDRVPPRFRHLLLVRAAHAELALGRTQAAAARLTEVIDTAAGGPAASLTWIDARRLLGAATHDRDMLAEAYDLSVQRDAAFLQASSLFSLGLESPGDAGLLREAYERFHALGANPWRRRVAAELRARGHKVPRHRAPRPAVLTDVELQVARLVQLGSKNRDIAQALSVSVKTVEAYLTRIYAKLGCSSRLELARALDEYSRPLNVGTVPVPGAAGGANTWPSADQAPFPGRGGRAARRVARLAACRARQAPRRAVGRAARHRDRDGPGTSPAAGPVGPRFHPIRLAGGMRGGRRYGAAQGCCLRGTGHGGLPRAAGALHGRDALPRTGEVRARASRAGPGRRGPRRRDLVPGLLRARGRQRSCGAALPGGTRRL